MQLKVCSYLPDHFGDEVGSLYFDILTELRLCSLGCATTSEICGGPCGLSGDLM